MEKTESFKAGVKAAQDGVNINNSYPHNHEQFVAGYKSVKPDAMENTALKELAMKLAPDEYKKLF